ncbi:ketopantoate reductase family protein [Bordetella genomosp. 11]|nr:2-dehydropantoate 2-reductase [Bordetella genomosp. 11]
MDVCVFGAGAIGGFMAARLAADGQAKVSVIARGAHLAAIQTHGLRVLSTGGDIAARPAHAVDRPQDLPPQDIVFVTLKAYALPAAASAIAVLLKPGGHAVFVTNGLTWWWKHGLPDPGPLPLLDPDGALWNTLTPQRVLGCVVYAPTEVIEPGVVRHTGPNRWLLGEPDGADSARLRATIELMRHAGLGAEAPADLRREVWSKLMRNAALNPLCALTRLPSNELASDPQLLAIGDGIIAELVAIAAAQGNHVEDQAEEARSALRRGGPAGNKPVGGMRPSMLQDALAGRPTEVEAILGQLQAFAREAGVPCPHIDGVLPLMRGLDRSLRLSRD